MPNTASASVLPWTWAIPQSSRVMVACCARAAVEARASSSARPILKVEVVMAGNPNMRRRAHLTPVRPDEGCQPLDWRPRLPHSAAGMSKAWFVLVSTLLLLAACQKPPAEPAAELPTSASAAAAEGSGAIISAPTAVAAPLDEDVLGGTKWPPATLTSGKASISCSTDYVEVGDGQSLVDLGFLSVLDAMTPCREAGVVRLRYEGKVAADFADLVERVTAMAERMGIDKRILDIDSAGGQVEDAIRAGDTIANTHWTIWVREGGMCHSACVFILAAGDNRLVSGPVGIHRIIRLYSKATTRAELEQELRAVHDRIKGYFARNGADV